VTALMADGTNPGGNYGDWVDVAAPGLSVHTTKVGGGYGTFSGTSAASPHVAGLAGLLLSVRPELTPDEVRQIIMDSSEPLDWPDTPIAAGRVNAYAALVETGVSEDVAAAMTARLRGNYPNPFNPVTRIEYELAARSRVSLSVYDLTGRRVRSLLASEQLDSGPHTTVWDGLDDSGRAVASGAYFYRLEAGTEALSRKMILVK